jgi:hypothetical protein
MAKEGRTLGMLAQEIERQYESKRDYIAPVTKVSMLATSDRPPALVLDNKQKWPLSPLAHNQMAEYTGIPTAYYRRMLEEEPALLSTNVNRWLRNPTDRRMIRTLDGKVRAFLSDKFRPLENYDLAHAILPVLMERKLMILSCEVTETSLYIKAVDRTIENDVPTGARMGDGGHTIFDTCCPGITIRNSEVGMGALSIASTIWTKACTNLADFGTCLRKSHLGKRADISDDVYALLTDNTRALTDAALWAQTRDVVVAAFDQAKFAAQCKKLGQAAEQKLPVADLGEVIEVVGKRFDLNQDERKGVLGKLVEGHDFTRYGLHAAVTRFSQENEVSYDRATDLERVGGKIIELSNTEWEELAAAA